MRAILVLLFCLCVTPAWAVEEFKPLTTLQDAAVATGNGTALDVALYNSVALEVTIATTATVTFEGTVDGSTWASTVCTSIANTSATLVTSATATGTYQCNVAGLSKFRARISSWTSGAVTVKARATTAVISRRGGAGGSGAPTDATYIMQTANGSTSAEQALGALATGCLGSTTTTGVVAARTLTGTANEIDIANGDCSGTPTFSLSSTIDLGGKTSFEVPNGAAPTTDAFGEIAGDNNAWAASRGAIQFFDGTANTYIIGALASDTPGNGECIKWNTGGTITWETCGSGSMATDTLWDVAGDLAYGTGSNTGGRLAIGTAGQVLGVNAGATAPEWKSTLTALTSISFGADPGDGSPLNLSNNTCINWEIATPGTDKCLKVNASDQLDFNGTLNLSGATTGSVVINGVTSGSFTITGADAMAQSVTATVAAQTSGATVLTIPDMAGVNDTFAFIAKAGTFTNKTLDAEGTGNVITVPRRIWLPAAGCNNATAGSIWDLPTSNAPAAACITGTNTQKGVLDFDATTDESAQITYLLPSTFTGNIDARIYWLAAATTGSVGWCVQLVSTADAETDDPAFPAQGAGNCVSDAAKGTTLQVNSASITSVTATGVAASELLHIQISRDANGGAVTDDMTGDARLIGVELVIREAM